MNKYIDKESDRYMRECFVINRESNSKAISKLNHDNPNTLSIIEYKLTEAERLPVDVAISMSALGIKFV